MTEQIPEAKAEKTQDPERWKNLAVLLTVIATILAAVVAGLSADAGIVASQANSESQMYAIQISGEVERVGLENTYELGTLATYVRDLDEAIKMQSLAIDLRSKGKEAEANMAQLQTEAAMARTQRAKNLSVLFTDPRYANADGMPNATQYVTDTHASAMGLLAKQNAAVDTYQKWNSKTDSYSAILTTLAVILLIFGLAQAVSVQLRLPFIIFGGLGTAIATAWVISVVAA